MQLLFVCTGNTCRSAMAKAIAQKFINDNPLQYSSHVVDSAGLMCAGPSPASFNAVIVAEQNGCDLSEHAAKQISESLLAKADYIFVMTRGHKQLLEQIAPQYQDKVFLLNAYAEGNPDATDIIDPYGGDVAIYQQCFELLQKSIAQILEKLE